MIYHLLLLSLLFFFLFFSSRVYRGTYAISLLALCTAIFRDDLHFDGYVALPSPLPLPPGLDLQLNYILIATTYRISRAFRLVSVMPAVCMLVENFGITRIFKKKVIYIFVVVSVESRGT
ncbi:hypothetical protein F5X96DRAFT_621325 [Biscogniauxia mediterranea]|nr:hypothetical protein F5X96DRAFT_621325 [Biscogniauxia mediterranea]